MPTARMYFEELKETIHVKAIFAYKNDLVDVLDHLKGKLKKIKRLPNIIHLNKNYSTFEMVISERLKDKDVSILIKDEEIRSVVGYEVSEISIILKTNYFSYIELLKKLIPSECIVTSFETIGHIIHLNLNNEQLKYKNIIGDVLHYKTGMTVINKIGTINNEYRYYESEVLAGEKKLKSFHVENKLKIFIDLEKVYWCSKLQTERMKIAEKTKKGEVVCDAFCGVGALLLYLLKKEAKVIANDLNPEAIKCFKTSLKENKFECENIYCMDAGAFLESQQNKKIDRFVFNLPEHSLEYIKYLKMFRNFYLHCFFFYKEEYSDLVSFVKSVTGLDVKTEWFRMVRKVSPSKTFYVMEVDDVNLFGRKFI